MMFDFRSISVYLVTDPALSLGRSELDVVRAAAAGGIQLVQYRDKLASKRLYLEKAKRLAQLCRELGIGLILNDHVDIAALVDCAGIHLGQDDLPTAEARALLGPTKAIGRSTHNLSQALLAFGEGADYLNVGPVFATNTKATPVKPVGLDMVREITQRVTIPVTTMGGIQLGNLSQVIDAGADIVAVVTAITLAPDITSASRELIALAKSVKQARTPA